MSQTFNFEELDANTRDYLTEVRDTQGVGAPGVFAPTTSAMAGCGCISGIVVIVATLLLTLTDWVNVVFDEPTRVAMLQTGGLLLGGWLVAAAIRSSGSKGSKTFAGHWVYADALHLYEAYREQVTVTPISGVSEANFTHNYNDGSYQNSIVRIMFSGGGTSVTFKNEAKAEQLVVFLNYLAWARSAEGGARATLLPAQLGGLARYVAEHDVEPKNHDDTLNLDLTHTGIDAVPEEPTREGRAAPSILPYIVLVVAGIGVFFLMKEVVNPPVRDDAMYKAITTPEQTVEPVFLRVYLSDERNTKHRDDVLARLKRFYSQAVDHIQRRGDTNPQLKDGMVQLLQSLTGPEQPAVSLKVEEVGPPDGAAEAQKRVDSLRDGLVGGIDLQRSDPPIYIPKGGIIGALSTAMPAVRHPDPTVKFTEARFPVGAQLIDFAKIPEGATHAHIEVTYQFKPHAEGRYRLWAKVEFRTQLDANAVATYEGEMPGEFAENQFATAIQALKDTLVHGMVGRWNPPGLVPPNPGFGIPPG